MTHRFDFTNPQWRERKLKKEMFEIFKHEIPRSNDEGLHFLLYVQSRIEKMLFYYYHNENKKFWHIFTDAILKKTNYSKEDFAEKLKQNITKIGVKYLFPAHCTGFEATAQLWREFPEKCLQCNVGTVIETNI